jgi:transposase-like protein
MHFQNSQPKPTNFGRRWTPAERKHVVDLKFNQGLSLVAIAETLGRSVQSIEHVWKQQGPIDLSPNVFSTIQPYNAWLPEEDGILKEHWKDNVSCTEIMQRPPGRTLVALTDRATALKLGSSLTKSHTHASKAEVMAVRRALEPVVNGTAKLDDAMKSSSSSSPQLVKTVLHRMRNNYYERKPPTATDTPASDR